MTMPFPRPPAHAVSLDAVWAAAYAARFHALFMQRPTNQDTAAEVAAEFADAAVAALERWRARERGAER